MKGIFFFLHPTKHKRTMDAIANANPQIVAAAEKATRFFDGWANGELLKEKARAEQLGPIAYQEELRAFIQHFSSTTTDPSE